MNILYKAKAISTGGRDGKVTVENSPLEFEMASPAELGGTKKEGANPEQLFAAGYAACFGSAMQHVIRERKIPIKVPTVQTTVGIGKNNAGGFSLAVDIVVTFKDIDKKIADELVKEAHLHVCPYSSATMGNIEVNVSSEIK